MFSGADWCVEMGCGAQTGWHVVESVIVVISSCIALGWVGHLQQLCHAFGCLKASPGRRIDLKHATGATSVKTQRRRSLLTFTMVVDAIHHVTVGCEEEGGIFVTQDLMGRSIPLFIDVFHDNGMTEERNDQMTNPWTIITKAQE